MKAIDRFRSLFSRSKPRSDNNGTGNSILERKVSTKEISKVKDALNKATNNIAIESIKSVIEKEEKTAEQKDPELLLEGFRYDTITLLHEGIDYPSDEERNRSIEIYAKSKMTIEEVKSFLDHLREFQRNSRTKIGTKLPQRSRPDFIR